MRCGMKGRIDIRVSYLNSHVLMMEVIYGFKVFEKYLAFQLLSWYVKTTTLLEASLWEPT